MGHHGRGKQRLQMELKQIISWLRDKDVRGPDVVTRSLRCKRVAEKKSESERDMW